jgi:hypothetical protein
LDICHDLKGNWSNKCRRKKRCHTHSWRLEELKWVRGFLRKKKDKDVEPAVFVENIDIHFD